MIHNVDNTDIKIANSYIDKSIKEISKLKDNISNIDNRVKKNEEIIDNRINNAFNTLSKELLDIYHLTRNKKNSNLYGSLPSSYKKMLYILHKTYMMVSNSNFDNEKIKKLCEIDDLEEEAMEVY